MTAERKARRALHSALSRLIDFLARLQGRLVPTDIECAEDEDDGFEPLTAEQHAMIRRAEPKGRGRVIETLLINDGSPDARPTFEFIDLSCADAAARKPRERLVEDPDHARSAPTATGQEPSEHLRDKPSSEAGVVRRSDDSIQSLNAEPDDAAAALKVQAEQRAEHLGNIVIGGLALLTLVCFVIAVLAILFMK